MNLSEHYKNHYTKGSTDYDETRFGSPKKLLSAERKNKVIENILAELFLRKDIKILDLATGTGRILVHLFNQGFNNITGSDITAAMIEKAKEKLKSKNGVNFLICDMKSITQSDDFYDVATVGSFFYLIPLKEYSEYIADIRRVVKNKGYVICEISNALHLLNPITFIKVLIHKYVYKKEIKSYVYPWQLNKLFKGLKFFKAYGIEYPLLVTENNYLFNFFSSTSILKYLGGKFTVVYQIEK